jgi:hypothetical protein
LATPANQTEAQLRTALDQAAARDADEVALRRIWARLAEIPTLVPSGGSERDAQAHAHAPSVEGSGEAPERDLLLRNARASRARWPWIVAASLAGATATLAFMLVETKSEFRGGRGEEAVGATPGSVSTSAGTDAGQRSTLVAPATVRTAFGETLHLHLRGGTEVVVTSESTLVLDQNDRPTVSAGEVQFHVPHQAAGQTFAVAAGEYRVVVVGTRFRVRVNQSSAAVGVDEGVVEIWSDRRLARVAAGESWVSPVRARESAHTPSDDATDEAASAPAVGLPPLKPNRGSRWSSPSRPILALAAPAVAVDPGQTPEADPLDTIVPVQSDRTAPSFAPAPTTAVTAAAPLALQARAARAAGDGRRAIGLYRALVQKGGAAGENAEYEIGRVLRDSLQQPREALSAWRSYRAQHPRGLLRIEADISVIETLVSLGDKAEAASEASAFIRRYPDSERRAEIARLAGDLLRERGAYGDAIGAYDIALTSGHTRRSLSDAAAFHRSVCLLRVDGTQGMAAVRAYLDSFPVGRFRGDAERMMSGRPATESPVVAPR